MKPSLHQGDLVGLSVKGNPQFGRLIALKGTRAVVSLSGAGREYELPVRELTVLETKLFEGQTQEQLPTIAEIRKLILPAKDLIVGWRLLESDRSVNQQSEAALTVSELTELLLGCVDTLHLAALWIWLNGEQPFFRLRRDHLVEPRPFVDVQRIRKNSRNQRIRQQQRQVALRLLFNDQPLSTNQWEQLPEDLQAQLKRLIQLADGPEEILLADEQAIELMRELRLAINLRELSSWLISKGWRDPHALPTLRGSAWSKQFEPPVQSQANQLLVDHHEQTLAQDQQRIDLSALTTYTLDDAQTEEIDDALSLEKTQEHQWIWVHIADPARLIDPGSELDREARQRATSLYLADGTRSMLPMALAAEALSLRAGQRCAALSVAIALNDQGGIEATRITRSWVKPRYRLTYEDGDELIELAPPGDQDLATLSTLLNKRLQWRQQQGALQMEQAEGRFQVTDQQPELRVVLPCPARRLVSEAMILMGTAIAQFGQQHNLSLPYRSQPPSELPSSTELNQLNDGPVRHAAIKRCLSRGVLGTRPMAHFSLGLPAYVQASSPIRRYADLLAHRQVIAQLEGGCPLDEEALAEQLDQLNGPLRQAQQISREDQRHWQQVWFMSNRDQQWPAVFLRWLRPQDQLALVHIESLAMELACTINLKKDADPGQSVIMRIQSVDPLADELKLIAS